MRDRSTLLVVNLPFLRFTQIVTITLLCLCLLPSQLMAQPANDDCGNAITVNNLNGGCSNYNNTDATVDLLNGTCVNQGVGAFNVWFQFTAIGTEIDIISTMQGGVPMEITLLEFTPTACDFASANQLSCANSPLNLMGALTPGNTYYIVVTNPNNSFVPFNLCVDNYFPNPPPPNDDLCNHEAITPDGSCTNGTTVNATVDYANGDPACAGLFENTVYYSTTLGPGMNALDLDIQGFNGNVAVTLLTLAPNCMNPPVILDYYCGPSGALPLTITGLTENTTYYIQVSTSTAEESAFQICATENGPPPGCSLNDFCNQAEALSVTSGQPCNQVAGCNIGASSEPSLTGCNMATEEVVWYSFTSDGTAGLLSLSVVSNNITQPTVEVFAGNCNGLNSVTGCITGNNGTASIVNQSISPNTNYLIAVSNSFGNGGNFDLCVLTFDDISACVTDSELYVSPGSPSLGSPDNGPYQPGETVTFCFDLNTYTADPIGSGNNCQWLQGIVPVFGDCWDPNMFDPSASEPPSLYGGNWAWHTNITYNNNNPNISIADCDGNGVTDICHITEPGCCNVGTGAGQVVPPGWFADMGGSPNNTFGDGNCCNCTMGPWSFCFDLTTKPYPECDTDPSFTDCSVRVYTFADGETGSWNGGASTCAQDVPQIQNNIMNCCEGPTVNYAEYEVCSGGSVFIPITSNQDPDVTYSWTVSPSDNPPNPNQYGATSGSGNSINQTLTNNTGAPVVVIYTIFPTNASLGCAGLPVDIPVTIYPDVQVFVDPVLPVCAGSCVDLSVSAAGGNENFVSYVWDQGLGSGQFVQACPTVSTTYNVTVTDNLGCSGVGSVTVQANSNLLLDINADPGVTICDNDPNFPIFLEAVVNAGGSGNYDYEWSTGGGNNVTTADATDLYSVTVTDQITGCTGEQFIDITVYEEPFAEIIPPSQVCVTETSVCFLPFPDGGVWGGDVDAGGCLNPSALGAGDYQVTYTFTDNNLCSTVVVYDFTIDDVPAQPQQLPDISLCQGGPPANYTVTPVAGAFNYTWTIPADATIVNGQGTNSIVVNWTGSMGGQVCVTANNDCGPSSQSCFNVTVTGAPAMPTPPANDTLCAGTSGAIYTVTADPVATTYAWTVPTGASITAGQGSNMITVDWGTATSGQVCVTAANGCGNSPQACFDATINTAPAAPVSPGDATICAGAQNDMYSVAPVAGATAYTWTIPAGATIVSGQGTNTITINWGAATSGQVCVTADNLCGSSPQTCFNVNIGTVPGTPIPPGNATVCEGDQGDTYSITPVASATSYVWSVPAGATITAGQGTTGITMDWGTATSGQVCVLANNNCGDSPQACFDVTVDQIPVAPIPPTNNTVCEGDQNDNYSVATVTGATSYTWTVPAGASITTGQGTNSIDIDWGTAATGQVCVTANNNCGNSPQACFDVTIDVIPASPVAPNDATICAGLASDTYSITPVTGATTYNWTIPAGATILNGQGTTSIEIDWGTATTGQVCVDAGNNCGDSAPSCFDVTIGDVPADPVPPIDDNVCAGTPNSNYAIAPVATATNYTWTVPAGATITNGQGSTSINVDWGTAVSGQICVTAENNCGPSNQTCFDITVDDVPQSPTPPTDATICAGLQGDSYSINPVTGATSYTWTVPGSASITSGQGTTSIDIDWNNNAVSGQICVSADNNCGMSPDVCFDVTVEDVPAEPTPPLDAIVCEGTTNDTYTIADVPDATDYDWTVPAGANITSGQGTTSIDIDWGTAGSGQVCVTASNNCGDSPQACFDVTIDNVPQSPIPPANATICEGLQNDNYSIGNVPGATTYNWTVPAGANITAGQGSTSIDIDWGTAATGQVCVTAGNNCGDSPQACFDVTIDQAPVAPTPPADDAVCAGEAAAQYSITAVNGADDYTWTIPGGATITSGQGTTLIDVDWGAAVSGQICVTANNDCGASPQACFGVTINPIPQADFTVETPICSDAVSLVTYTGPPTVGATFNWNFNGGTDATGASGPGPYSIEWATPGVYTVSLTIDENGCTSTAQTQTVTVEAPLPAPVINCVTTTTSIEFSWDAIPGAVEYLVNGVPQPGTVYTESGLSSGQSVTITVVAVGNGACGNSEATATCTAEDCPIISIDIDPVNDICLDNTASSIFLTANVMGGAGGGTGVWTGNGIIDQATGEFDPNDASVMLGANVITYTYSEGPCNYNGTVDIMVNPQPTADFTFDSPICADDTITINYTGNANAQATFNWDFGAADFVVGTGAGPYQVHWPAGGNENITLTVTSASNCSSPVNTQSIVIDNPLPVPNIVCNSGTDFIEFSWDAIPGAVEYLVDGVPQAGTIYTESGLSAGDMITITVVAVGNGACGNSQATQTCTADDCPPVQINIDPISDICLDQNATSVFLIATTAGGAGNGTGVWQGPGIVDANTGEFDPNAPTVTPGINTVTYFYDEGDCSYSETIDIVVNEQPEAIFSVQTPVCAGDPVTVMYTGVFSPISTYDWDFGPGAVVDLGNETYEITYAAGGAQNITLQVTANGCSSEVGTESVQIDSPLPAPVITCTSTTTSVEFSWDAIPGANGYTVNGTPQGGTTYSETGLNTGDVVTITVVAIGTGACGNSEATAQCTAEDCPPVQINITPVADLCQDAGAATILLNADVVGGNGMGTGFWDGPGIIDPATGEFDVNAIGVTPGINTVTYFYSEPPCNFNASVDINVNAVPVSSFDISSPICEGDIISVAYTGTFSPTATYVWDFGTGTIDSDLGNESYMIEFATSGAPNITLTVTDNGCTSETTIESIQVDAQLAEPMITCTSTTTSVEFSWPPVVGATGYLVNGTPQAGTTYEETGLNTGDMVTITVVAVGNGACGNSQATATCEASDCPPVSLNFEPVADLCLDGNPSALIDLEVTIMGSNGTGTGTWSGPGIIDPVTGMFDPDDPSVFNGANNILFTFEEDNCTFSVNGVVNVFNQPSVEAGTDELINCGAPVITLAGSGSGTPLWTGPSIDSGEDTYMPQISGPGVYTLTVTDPSGCTATDQVTVNADASFPVAIAGEDTFITCDSSTVTLIAGGTLGDPYEVTWVGPGVVDQNDPYQVVDQPGWYILTITNTDFGCTSEADSVFVDENTIPPNAIIQFTGSLDCFNTSVLLTAETGPNTTFEWTQPDGSSSTDITIEATIGGTYTLTVVDILNGCVSAVTEVLDDITAYPLVEAGLPQELDCATPSVTLDGTGSQVGPTIEYEWEGPAGGITGPLDELVTTATLPGMYILTVFDNFNSCTNTDTVFITEDTNMPMAEAGDAQTFGCTDDELSLSGAGSTGANAYQWSDAAGNVFSTDVDATITDPGLYYLTAINTDNECTDIDSVLIDINGDVPYDLIASVTHPTCFGDNDGFILVEEVLGGTAPYTYSIDGENYINFPQFAFLSGGNYTVSIEDAEGCTFETELQVIEPAQLTLDLDTELNIQMGQGGSIVATPNIPFGQVDTIIWTPMEFLQCDNDTTNCFSPELDSFLLYTTTFTAFLVDTLGCSVEESVTISVAKDRPIYIPNAFSPNGDGINDIFMIYDGNYEVKEVRYFNIFNRWGEVVFEGRNFQAEDPEFGWDGRFKGEALNPGVYVYVAEVEFIDGVRILYKGDVTIMK